MASLIFCCVFSPKPLYKSSLFSSHAYNNSPGVSISSSFHITAIFFGPMPLIPSISIIPAGVFASISSNSESRPVAICSCILLLTLSPMPLMDAIFSAGISVSCMGSFSIVNAATEYDFDLKLFSPCISINLASSEKLSAMA